MTVIVCGVLRSGSVNFGDDGRGAAPLTSTDFAGDADLDDRGKGRRETERQRRPGSSCASACSAVRHAGYAGRGDAADDLGRERHRRRRWRTDRPQRRLERTFGNVVAPPADILALGHDGERGPGVLRADAGRQGGRRILPERVRRQRGNGPERKPPIEPELEGNILAFDFVHGLRERRPRGEAPEGGARDERAGHHPRPGRPAARSGQFAGVFGRKTRGERGLRAVRCHGFSLRATASDPRMGLSDVQRARARKGSCRTRAKDTACRA